MVVARVTRRWPVVGVWGGRSHRTSPGMTPRQAAPAANSRSRAARAGRALECRLQASGAGSGGWDRRMKGGDRVWMASVLAATIGAAGCWSDVPVRRSPAGDCALDGGDAENERSPGYPYDFEAFKSDIAPLLVADCTGGGCHADGPASGSGGFTVFAGTAGAGCADVLTFKEFRDEVDLTLPAASRMIFALEGGELTGDVPHPLDYTAAPGGQARLDAVAAFIDGAHEACVAGGGCSPEVRDFFDDQAFQTGIQPGLDAAGCAASAACHALPDGQRGFALPASPAADSPEMEAAYQAVKSRVSLDAEPGATLLYAKATRPHGGGSTPVDADTDAALVAWIEAAIAVHGEADDLGCASPARLDLGVFRDEILPILTGDVNLNDPGGQSLATGCTRGPCHGQPRPGGLTLIPTDPPETQLANFACFVSLISPVSSQVLVCPRDVPGCVVSPHPGARLLVGVEDLNYQRLLSFLFSSVTDVTPIDFAFFARRINPMFDNRGAVEDGAQHRSCADTLQCHGVAAAGGAPPNGANLGIIPGAGDDLYRLGANFIEASAFINFFSPDQSSLFLYPTDEIADLDNPVATGFHHPGGADFTPDSAFARDILTFARGLRPDSGGFQRYWLVAGDYPAASSIFEETPVDEESVRPALLDECGGLSHGGRWDALFADGETVDVGEFLGGEVGSGRIAYAASYLYNATLNDLEVDVEVSADSEARVSVGDAEARVAAGGTIVLPVVIPSSRASDSPTGMRVLVKLLERPEDGGMRFRVRLLHGDSDRPFDDVRTELFIKLGPRGGV
jgi:hypothetical protein